MKKTLCYILLTVFSIQISAQNITKYTFENIGVEKGLTQSAVVDFVQDKKGFLWIATHDGLNRYDGYSFKNFRPDFENPKSSLSERYLTALELDKFGNILIGNYHGLDIYEAEKELFYHFISKPKNELSTTGRLVWNIFTDQKNNYWSFNGNGLSKMTFPIQNSFDSVIIQNYSTFFGKELSPPGKFVLLLDKNHNFIVLIDNKIYFIDKENTNFTDLDLEKFPNNSFQFSTESSETVSIGTDANKDIWVLYTNKVEKILDFKMHKTQTYYFKEKLETSVIKPFFAGSDSCIYISIPLQGLIAIDLKTTEKKLLKKEPDNAKCIGSNYITIIFEDAKGALWFGTDAGISKCNTKKNKFTHVEAKSGVQSWLQDNKVYSFEEDRHGNIWVGTWLGKGIYIYNKKNKTFKNIPSNKIRKKPFGGTEIIFAIFKDKEGQIWIGTNSGLGKYDEKNDKINYYTNNPNDSTSISNNIIFDIAEDKAGFLWVATYNGFNKLDKKTGKFYRYSPMGKIVPNKINLHYYFCSMLINDDGSLWLGTGGEGLFKLTFDKDGKPHYKNFPANPIDPSSLSMSNTFSLLKDRDGDIWIPTFGGGLNKFNVKTEKFKRYTIKNGLPNNVVHGVLQDKLGRIWGSTNYGLFMLDQQSGKITNYTIKDGLQSNEFYPGSLFKDSEGLIYFGGINGYNVFDPLSIQLDTTTAEVMFTDLKLINKSVVPGVNSPLKKSISYANEITLTYRQRDFTIEFASNNYNSPEDNQFAYMIENYNTDWVDNGKKHSLSFVSFPPGTYILKVKTANPDGVWSKNYSSIKLIIKPPFWKTTWFIIVCIILIFLMFFLYIHLRTKKLIKDKRKLEQKVKERTAEIEKQKDEILEKNEELLQQNEEILTQHDVIMLQREEIEKYKNNRLDEHEKTEYLQRLTSYMQKNKPYLNPEISLESLANDISIDIRSLSQIINETFKNNFNGYINEFRIQESLKQLSDKKNKKTILEIVFESGFNSKSAFYAEFKRQTGLTPLEYRAKC